MNNSNLLIKTYYGIVHTRVMMKAKNVRLLILDIDGVLSNGLTYVSSNGEEMKAFNVRDGYGIRCALRFGIKIAIITGCASALVTNRCKTLGIKYIYQSQSDKTIAFHDLLNKLDISAENTAYIGDDLIDWPVMKQVGLSISVANAHPMLISLADYVTHIDGGNGAVREVCDLLLLSQGSICDII